MLPHEQYSRRTFEFRYMTASRLSMRLHGIGWQSVTSTDYHYNGLRRPDGEGAIFQFTLSGQGAIRYGNREYLVPKHCAFLCTLPSDHVYFFDDAFDHWEFLFIAVRGDDAIRHWLSLIDRFGPVIPFGDKLDPMLCVSRLYSQICGEANPDRYDVSAQLYRFILEMDRFADGYDSEPYQDGSEPLQNAIRFIQSQYASPLSLDDIADVAGLSKSHFSRVFLHKTGIQPMQYLRKIRIEKASALLAQTPKTLETIAKETGFDNSKYLIRVFKALVGTTPNQYRQTSGFGVTRTLRIER
ncbi:helix-turn-helix domain-containing protein [Paenibacillus hemerocallicola]|uniref:helix-turn-helix domain-containing protein n=1 Tax=Paenibacillus hemerocallicola TaxID=1172614 RepID=UPI00159EDBB6|nr:AraC family transcriptional regulator [Paenibacillus hemerocallicola]